MARASSTTASAIQTAAQRVVVLGDIGDVLPRRRPSRMRGLGVSLEAMARPLIGVVHLLPLPSAPRHSSMQEVLERALADARSLRDGGVDGIVVENFGDAPFHRGGRDDPVPPDVPAAISLCAYLIRQETGLPIGVNCLRNDAAAAMGIAAACGASWIRANVWTSARLTDQGIVQGDAASVLAYRKRLGSPVRVLADLFVKHSAPLADIDPAEAAKDLAERSGADGLILTGSRTGEGVDPETLKIVRAAVAGFPIWIGSGLRPENAGDLWPLCDGAIVGTFFEKAPGGPVDGGKVAALRRLCPA
ncbi:MAG: BtpA/SgcQ family protein [Planctomycetota bacterium]